MLKKSEIELGIQARTVLDEYCHDHNLPHVGGNSFNGRSKDQFWDFWLNGTVVATVDMTKKTVKILGASHSHRL